MTILLFLAALIAVAGPQVELRLLDGRVVAGQLVSLDDKQVAITVEGQSQTFVAAQMLSLHIKGESAAPLAKPAVWVELLDGSTLSGADFRASKSLATLVIEQQDSLELPVKSIHTVRFSDPAAANRAWSENLAGKSTADLLAVRKKENLDFLEGVIGEVDAESVRFTLDDDVIPVKRAKIDGLIYFRRAADGLSSPAAVIDDCAGRRMYAKSFAVDDAAIKIITPAGVNISRPLAEIAKIDLSSGKLTFLSDMPVDKVEWQPYFDFGKSAPALAKLYRPRLNQGRDGTLRLDGKPYAKGLQLFAKTTYIIRLPDKSRQFLATVGIDDAVRDLGHVRLQIFADENKLLDTPIAGSEPPKPLELELAGARRLKIVVDFGEDQPVGGCLDLCDARIVK